MPDDKNQASLTGQGQQGTPTYSRTTRELASLIPREHTAPPIPTIHQASAAGPSWMEQWDAAVASGRVPPAMVKHVQRQAAGGQVDPWKIAGWVKQAQPYIKQIATGAEHIPGVTDVPTGVELFEAAPQVVDFPVSYAAEFPGVSVTEDFPATYAEFPTITDDFDFPDISVTEEVGIGLPRVTYSARYGGPVTGVERRIDFESSAGFVMFTSDPWAPGVGLGPGVGVGLMPDPEEEKHRKEVERLFRAFMTGRKRVTREEMRILVRQLMKFVRSGKDIAARIRAVTDALKALLASPRYLDRIAAQMAILLFAIRLLGGFLRGNTRQRLERLMIVLKSLLADYTRPGGQELSERIKTILRILLGEFLPKARLLGRHASLKQLLGDLKILFFIIALAPREIRLLIYDAIDALLLKWFEEHHGLHGSHTDLRLGIIYTEMRGLLGGLPHWLRRRVIKLIHQLVIDWQMKNLDVRLGQAPPWEGIGELKNEINEISHIID